MPYCKNCGNEIPSGAVYCPKCGTPAQALIGIKQADWGERIVAWLIDIILFSIIIIPIRTFVWLAWPSVGSALSIPSWIPFVDFGLSNVIHFLYWMLMEGMYGQSLGKMIMKLKVTRLDGKPINFTQAAIQSVGKAFLLPLDCILGWILYPTKRQRLFNYLSETIVTRL
jgi:uncharacterized RDD family membrane protein YckC